MFRKISSTVIYTIAIMITFTVCAFAQEATNVNPASTNAASIAIVASCIALGLGTLGVGIGQGMAVSKSVEAAGRNPESTSKVQLLMILGLAFLETVVIYALVVALLLIFNNPFLK